MQKRGLSHIEVIMSFILFSAAVGFALYFFSPFNSTRLVDSSLTYTFREITNNASVDVQTLSIKLNNGGNKIGNILAIRIDEVSANGLRSRVEMSDGTVVVSHLENNIVYVRNTIPHWDENDFIIVKLSQDFDQTPSIPAVSVNESFYEVISSTSETLISEKKIIELREKYLIDYLGIKTDFNLPNRVNFGFSVFFDADDKIEAKREIAQGLDVFSSSERRPILKSNGEIKFADVSVSVW